MAALVCDICGGKLSMGAGGIAVCGSCGMEHSKDRMQEKIQEIKGTVRIDNSHMVDNYLNIAQTAYDASNLTEAESYCNKSIEIDPTNYKAWLIKGMSAGWQSTLSNPRFAESVAAFSKSIANAPEEEKEALIDQTKNEIVKLAGALINLRSQRYEQWPDEDETEGFKKDLISIYEAIKQYITQVGEKLEPTEVMRPIALQIHASILKTWHEKVLPDYHGEENKPDKSEWSTFIDREGYCRELLLIAIDLSEDDDDMDVLRYELLVELEQTAIDSCSWDYEFTSYGGKLWSKDYVLSDKAIEIRKKFIMEYKNKIAQVKQEIATKKAKEAAELAELEAKLAEVKYNSYWNAHTEEKSKLEAENENLKNQIDKYEAEIQTLQSNQEIINLEQHKRKLEQDLTSLGIFKRQEKKILQEKINSVIAELNNLTAKRDDSIQQIKEQLNPLKETFAANHEELTKAR